MIEQINNAGHCIKKVAKLMTLQIAIVVVSCCFVPIMIDDRSSSETIVLTSLVFSISQLVLIVKIITNLSNAGEYLLEVVKETPKKNDNTNAIKPMNNTTTIKAIDITKNSDDWIDEFV